MTWHVYRFENDDDNRWTPLEKFDNSEYKVDLKTLRAAFLAAGWDGDGNLEFAFMPPWLKDGGNTFWFPVFHVKQSNHGRSFVAAEQEIAIVENFDKVAQR